MTRDRLELEGAKEHGQDRGWWIAEVITQPVTSGVQSADINVRGRFSRPAPFPPGPPSGWPRAHSGSIPRPSESSEGNFPARSKVPHDDAGSQNRSRCDRDGIRSRRIDPAGSFFRPVLEAESRLQRENSAGFWLSIKDIRIDPAGSFFFLIF